MTLLRPNYIQAYDYPWVMQVLEISRSMVGKKKTEVSTYIRETITVKNAAKLKLVLSSIESHIPKAASEPNIDASRVRQRLFLAQGLRTGHDLYSTGSIHQVLMELSTELLVTVPQLKEMMFADISSEQVQGSLNEELSIDKIVALANEKLIQQHLRQSHFAILRIRGGARRIVRQAKLHGLICQVKKYHNLSADEASDARTKESPPDYAELYLSGPLSLFRRTSLYARAFASILPLLAWSEKFQLLIYKAKDLSTPPLCVQTGDPIKPSLAPRIYDSKVEQKFAREFLNKTKDWVLVREHSPIALRGERCIFPDFKITHHQNPQWFCYLEIVGYWTDAYLQKKLKDLTEANINNLLICLDQKHQNADFGAQFPNEVIIYKKFISVDVVIEKLLSFYVGAAQSQSENILP